MRPGDELRVRIAGFDRILVVQEPISKRVGAVPAAAAVEDKTPPPLPREERAFVPMRDRGAGRPTKRERRDIDKLRGRAVDGLEGPDPQARTTMGHTRRTRGTNGSTCVTPGDITHRRSDDLCAATRDYES